MSTQVDKDIACCLVKTEKHIEEAIATLGDITSRGEQLRTLDSVYERLLSVRTVTQMAMGLAAIRRMMTPAVPAVALDTDFGPVTLSSDG